MTINNDRYLNNNKENSLEYNNPLIKFKRNKIKSGIRFGKKLLLIFVVAGISAVFFSSLTMKLKYGKVMEQFKEIEKNKNDIILNYKDIIKVVSPSLVSISNSKEKLISNRYYSESSTGIILNNDGIVLTNFYNVKDLENLYVKVSSQGVAPIKAEFIGGNEEIDIAILKIEYDGPLTPIKIATSNDFSSGQSIAILSNSMGDDYIGNITPGIITSRNKKYMFNKSSKEYNLIETNAPINNENTGGALVNSKGELIGISSVYITNKNKQEGLFYAVDLSELETLVNSAMKFKSFLGLKGGNIVRDENNDIKGFYVENVEKGGNAYNGGIRPRDIVFEVEGNRIINLEDMGKAFENKKVGDIIDCKVMRNGKVEEINIVLGK